MVQDRFTYISVFCALSFWRFTRSINHSIIGPGKLKLLFGLWSKLYRALGSLYLVLGHSRLGSRLQEFQTLGKRQCELQSCSQLQLWRLRQALGLISFFISFFRKLILLSFFSNLLVTFFGACFRTQYNKRCLVFWLGWLAGKGWWIELRGLTFVWGTGLSDPAVWS